MSQGGGLLVLVNLNVSILPDIENVVYRRYVIEGKTVRQADDSTAGQMKAVIRTKKYARSSDDKWRTAGSILKGLPEDEPRTAAMRELFHRHPTRIPSAGLTAEVRELLQGQEEERILCEQMTKYVS